MLDGLSIAADVIALTEGVIEVVKYSKTSNQVSEELGELQARFEVLH